MKVVNIYVPLSLRTLNSGELKEFVFNIISGRAGKDLLAEILSARYDTKRKISMVINRIPQSDLTEFYCDIRMAGATIDYKRTYLMTAEPFRGLLALKQA